MALSTTRYTVYDAMEARGAFKDNAANAGTPKYKGPEQFPKMFYHPLGEERVTIPADTQVSPWGPIKLWEQREIIHRIVETEEEAAALRAEGWHDHPAKAMRAAGKEAPAISSAEHVVELERRLAEMAEQLAEARAGMALKGREIV